MSPPIELPEFEAEFEAEFSRSGKEDLQRKISRELHGILPDTATVELISSRVTAVCDAFIRRQFATCKERFPPYSIPSVPTRRQLAAGEQTSRRYPTLTDASESSTAKRVDSGMSTLLSIKSEVTTPNSRNSEIKVSSLYNYHLSNAYHDPVHGSSAGPPLEFLYSQAAQTPPQFDPDVEGLEYNSFSAWYQPYAGGPPETNI
jgi:hypothetical protein